MEIPERGGPDFTVIGILILAAVSSSLWRGGPLESARPTSEREGWYEKKIEESVPARLWQDPFKAHEVHRLERAKLRKELGESIKREPTSQEKRLEDLRSILHQTKGDARTLIIGVMVNLGSYAEIEEQRRQMRYAVISGLGVARFVPKDSSSISAFSLKSDGWENDLFPYEWFTFEKRYGDYSKSASADRILLIWLDEAKFKKSPFERFSSLSKKLLLGNEKNQNITVFVLGPAESSTLQTMVEKAYENEYEKNLTTQQGSADDKEGEDVPGKNHICEIGQLGISGFHILSPVATVDDEDLYGELADPSSLHNWLSSTVCDLKEQANMPVTFLRTIRTDRHLADHLVAELKERKIDFCTDPIVLISEWDTYFGRSLPRAFENSVKKQCSFKPENLDIERYTYLRGIDGRTPIISKRLDAQTQSVDGARPDPVLGGNLKSLRRPAGTGQFDYVRRLAKDLEKKAQKLRLEKNTGIRAIGILGSDVYDKLLILRALRKDFRGALFFTTDLDAQLLQRSDFRWTRNLIVASSDGFGRQYKTKPAEAHEFKIPSFRSNYQTSMFKATRLAIDPAEYGCNDTLGNGLNCGDQCSFYQRLPVGLFEVGRHGAVPLKISQESLEKILNPSPGRSECTERSENRSNVAEKDSHPSSSWWDVWPLTDENQGRVYLAQLVLTIFTGLVLAILAVHMLWPKSGNIIFWLSVWVAALFVFVVLAMKAHFSGEPLSFTDGVSTWPTEFIRLCALFLAFYFIFRALKDLYENRKRLDKTYFGRECSRKEESSSKNQTRRGKFENLTPWLVATLFIVTTATFVKLGLPDVLSERYGVNVFTISVVVAAILVFFIFARHLILVHVLKTRSLSQWIAKVVKKDGNEFRFNAEENVPWIVSTVVVIACAGFAGFGLPEILSKQYSFNQSTLDLIVASVILDLTIIWLLVIVRILKVDSLHRGLTQNDWRDRNKLWEKIKPCVLPTVYLIIIVAFFAIGLPKILNAPNGINQLSISVIVAVVFFALIIFWRLIIFHVFKVESVGEWFEKQEDKKKYGAAEFYWSSYCQVSSAKDRVLRSTLILIVYLAFGSLIFLFLGHPEPPCRGDLNCAIDKAVLVPSVLVMLFLIFFVVDAVRLCIYWIRGLHQTKRTWNSSKFQELFERLKLPCEYATHLIKMELIADRTQEVVRLVYYPFFIIFVMLISRSVYFDNWGFPKPLMIVVALNLIVIGTSAVKLRFEAERTRKESVNSLREKLIKLGAETDTSEGSEGAETGIKARDKKTRTPSSSKGRNDPTPDQIKELIENINNIRVGAFRPFFEQPILRASLLLIAAVGISILEYGTLFY